MLYCSVARARQGHAIPPWSTRSGTQPLFGAASLERLRHDLGVNLAGIAVILDLRDRLTALQREIALWRRWSQ
jgi:DNA-binding transcriptional MerR regulator